MWRRLDEVASLGLPILITEASVVTDWGPDGGSPSCGLSEDEQSRALASLVAVWFSHPAVRGVTLWGFADAHVWVRGGGVFRADGSPKPAARALRAFFSSLHNPTLVNGAAGPGAGAGGAVAGAAPLAWRGYYGRYAAELMAGGRRHAAVFEVAPGGDGAVRIVVPQGGGALHAGRAPGPAPP
jgi:hypothetical protein